MSAIRFFVPGKPQGKGRPRAGKVAGKARLFTPQKTVAYEGLIANEARQAMQGRHPVECACRIELAIWCQVPASWSKTKQRLALDGAILPTTRPDADNVLKAVCDGMNGVVWRDDAQAADISILKRYGETPGVAVSVYEMTDSA